MTSDTTYTITCQTCSDQQKPNRSDQQNGTGQSDQQSDGQSDNQSVACRQDEVLGQYRGQTSRSMHSRMAEHMRGLKSKNNSCPLYRHKEDCHKNGDPKFTMKPTVKTKGNLHRLATESEQIGEGDDDKSVRLWNSKSEYGRSKLVRWKPTLEYV